ncbi:2-hydroxychromene-2-carboxylate isomerase [Candidatus Pelagibacter sp.]|nr:2-hydroxychromene-2-carboxylate isomerase [Candidatus Pelagibacter sp.]
MTKSIDFYFDFISPYSYIAHKRIKIIKEKNNVAFNYKPILLGGLHNLQGITAPAFNKSRLKYMIKDCELIAQKNNFDFIWNSKFPLNTLYVMRGYLHIKDDIKDLYTDKIFDAYWKNNQDVSNNSVIFDIIKNCNIDKDNFFNGIAKQEIKDKLKKLTQDAHDKEIFGAPTFVLKNKIFWGQDRLDFALEEYYK